MPLRLDRTADRLVWHWQQTGDPAPLVKALRAGATISKAALPALAACIEAPPKRKRGPTNRAAWHLRQLRDLEIALHAAELREAEPTIPAEVLIADVAEELGIPESRVSAALYPRKKSR